MLTVVTFSSVAMFLVVFSKLAFAYIEKAKKQRDETK